MGGSSWNDRAYTDRQVHRARTGADAFAYTSDVRAGREQPRVHRMMDPRGVTREARDSEAHPESRAIGVMFDVTGSMQGIPRVLQAQLHRLNELLTSTGIVEHPAILFGAIGDAHYDRAPLQVGQFESGLEMDDDLGRMFLEGGGGGGGHESYELAHYFFARHTATDCWEKRQQKGYLFTMGDEMPYASLSGDHAARICGDEAGRLQTRDLISECQERWHVFHLLIRQGTNYTSHTRTRWRELLGQNALDLDAPEHVCEAVALAIGVTEGRDVSSLLDGVDATVAEAVRGIRIRPETEAAR